MVKLEADAFRRMKTCVVDWSAGRLTWPKWKQAVFGLSNCNWLSALIAISDSSPCKAIDGDVVLAETAGGA